MSEGSLYNASTIWLINHDECGIPVRAVEHTRTVTSYVHVLSTAY